MNAKYVILFSNACFSIPILQEDKHTNSNNPNYHPQRHDNSKLGVFGLMSEQL